VAADGAVAPLDVPGLTWLASGQSALSGDLLELEDRLDRVFQAWAAHRCAVAYRVPTFIPVQDLARLDYFHSFPHLATFPVTLEASDANLARFARQPAAGGEVTLTDTAPVRDVLTPAACYHFYRLLRGRTLPGPTYLTTRAACFRREAHYAPLERQWSFSMREIVGLGTAGEVRAFLEAEQARVAAFAARLGLPLEFQPATDPFFDPSRNPKYLMQKLEPVKTEMVFQGRLAIGSVNFHRNYFGEAFEIRREGAEAFSGCVAFGIERWIAAVVRQFGPRAADWPPLAP
jgi:seryl-tRNA synthetase